MTTTQLMTAEDLYAMPEVPGKNFELVDGELVEMAGASLLHAYIVGTVFDAIGGFAREHCLGLAFADNTAYVLGRSPDVVRIPDASFVTWAHLPAGGLPERFAEFPPDLAVEVVSPGDTAGDVHQKVREYLDAGTRIVWVLWPEFKSLTWHAGRGSQELGADDVLDGGDVLPGFRIKVASFFELPARPEQT
jgi:Uma2 family endonuclease